MCYNTLTFANETKGKRGIMDIFGDIVYKDGEIIDNSWIKWIHWGVTDEEGEERERQRKQLAFFMHCLCCTALSGCYFAVNNKPKKSVL